MRDTPQPTIRERERKSCKKKAVTKGGAEGDQTSPPEDAGVRRPVSSRAASIYYGGQSRTFFFAIGIAVIDRCFFAGWIS